MRSQTKLHSAIRSIYVPVDFVNRAYSSIQSSRGNSKYLGVKVRLSAEDAKIEVPRRDGVSGRCHPIPQTISESVGSVVYTACI